MTPAAPRATSLSLGRSDGSRRGRFRVCVHALRNSGVTIIMPSASPNHQIRRNWKYTVSVPGIRP